jgi:hypothetical protein
LTTDFGALFALKKPGFSEKFGLGLNARCLTSAGRFLFPQSRMGANPFDKFRRAVFSWQLQILPVTIILDSYTRRSLK